MQKNVIEHLLESKASSCCTFIHRIHPAAGQCFLVLIMCQAFSMHYYS